MKEKNIYVIFRLHLFFSTPEKEENSDKYAAYVRLTVMLEKLNRCIP